jgi:hypothetical protein
MTKNTQNNKIFWQLTALVGSIIYIGIMINGYFNMFFSTVNSMGISLLIASILTLMGWLLAKLIAINGGIKNAIALFIPLVLLSAAGIFNAMMVNTQGPTIFREAVDEANSSFETLESNSEKLLRSDAVEALEGKVNNLKTAFFQEISNPINCGQGSAANRIFSELKTYLPDLTLLSGNKQCGNVDKLLPFYNKQITDGLLKHPTMLENKPKLDALNKIKELSAKRKTETDEAITNISANENLIVNVKPILETISRDYKTASDLLKNNIGKDQAKNIKSDLELDAVRSLGDVTKFPRLILSRMNDILMYFILMFAIGIDWILIYLLKRSSEMSDTEKPNILQQSSTPSGLKF